MQRAIPEVIALPVPRPPPINSFVSRLRPRAEGRRYPGGDGQLQQVVRNLDTMHRKRWRRRSKRSGIAIISKRNAHRNGVRGRVVRDPGRGFRARRLFEQGGGSRGLHTKPGVGAWACRAAGPSIIEGA